MSSRPISDRTYGWNVFCKKAIWHHFALVLRLFLVLHFFLIVLNLFRVICAFLFGCFFFYLLLSFSIFLGVYLHLFVVIFHLCNHFASFLGRSATLCSHSASLFGCFESLCCHFVSLFWLFASHGTRLKSVVGVHDKPISF